MIFGATMAVKDEAQELSPAALAGAVRVPAALALARKRWSELRRRYDLLQRAVREQVGALDATVAQGRPAIERRVAQINDEMSQLGDEVRAALAEVAAASKPFAAAVERALDSTRRDAARQALGAIDQLAGALATLDQIDHELRALGGPVWELHRLRPDLSALRRRINGLLS